MNCETAKSHVFPYVDDELPRDLRDEVDAHLATCRSCRGFVENELAFRQAYIGRLRPDPAPAHVRKKVDDLLTRLAGSGTARRRTARPWLYAMAAVMLLAVGVGAGMKLASVLERRTLLAELAESSVDQHQKLVRGLLPRDIADITPRAAEQWFGTRLDFPVTLPELKHANLKLVGARISHLASAEVAALEYRVDDKPVSLFVIPEDAYRRLGLSERPKFKVLSHRGYDVIIWRHHRTGYTLVSEIGGRSCLVCHAPDEKVDARMEPLARL